MGDDERRRGEGAEAPAEEAGRPRRDHARAAARTAGRGESEARERGVRDAEQEAGERVGAAQRFEGGRVEGGQERRAAEHADRGACGAGERVAGTSQDEAAQQACGLQAGQADPAGDGGEPGDGEGRGEAGPEDEAPGDLDRDLRDVGWEGGPGESWEKLTRPARAGQRVGAAHAAAVPGPASASWKMTSAQPGGMASASM